MRMIWIDPFLITGIAWHFGHYISKPPNHCGGLMQQDTRVWVSHLHGIGESQRDVSHSTVKKFAIVIVFDELLRIIRV